ncbi:MAG: hypothetical protein Q8O57_08285, partial [Kiritimatiellota bacterium]|nr:hypothetical protein [Kiritimatiellota bacterium]
WDVMAAQQKENEWAKQQNVGNWEKARDFMMQQVGLLDTGQQGGINRASNLINAAANTQRERLMGQLAQRGQLGGSSEQAMMGGLERDRMARLADAGNQLAAQRAQLGLGAAQTYLSELPQFMGQDLSGWGALFGAGQGGGGGFGQARRPQQQQQGWQPQGGGQGMGWGGMGVGGQPNMGGAWNNPAGNALGSGMTQNPQGYFNWGNDSWGNYLPQGLQNAYAQEGQYVP